MLLYNIDALIHEIKIDAVKTIASGGLKVLGNAGYIGTHGLINAGKELIAGNKAGLFKSLQGTRQQLKHSYNVIHSKKIAPYTADAKQEIRDLYVNPALRTTLKRTAIIGGAGAGLYMSGKFLLSHPLASAATGSTKKTINKITGYE